MTIPLIPIYSGDIPDRNAQEAPVFTLNAITWLDYQVIQIPATNATLDGINVAVVSVNADALIASNAAASASASEATSAANANFKGRWSDLTGELNVPAAVSHNGLTYQLLNDLADVTTSEPSITSDWVVINDIIMSNVRLNAINNPQTSLLKKNNIVDVLDPAGTLTTLRSTTATFIDQYGILRTAAIDIPRQEAAGWLLEESATNLLIRSAEFDNASWIKTRSSISANAIAAPNTLMEADELIEDSTASSTHLTEQSHTFSVGDNTLYFFAKANTRDEIRIRASDGITQFAAFFDLNAGTVGATTSLDSSEIKPLVNGWFRCSISFTAAAAAGLVQLRTAVSGDDVYSGDGSSSLYIWGGDLKEEPSPSSHIPTTTTSVTRAADLFTIPYLNNIPLPSNDWSIYISQDVFSLPMTGIFDRLFDTDLGGSATDRLRAFYSDTGDQIEVQNGGISLLVPNARSSDEIVINFKEATNTLSIYLDGLLAGSSSTGTPSSAIATDFKIARGHADTQHNSLNIRSFEVFGFTLNPDEIKLKKVV